jgi:hypothetical protein
MLQFLLQMGSLVTSYIKIAQLKILTSIRPGKLNNQTYEDTSNLFTVEHARLQKSIPELNEVSILGFLFW